MSTTDIDLIRDVNAHFSPFYPYLAAEISTGLPNDEADVLEIGPYSGGIAFELLKLKPRLRIRLGDDDTNVNDYLRALVEEKGLAQRITVDTIDKYDLRAADQSFDSVIFRGGLFFWDNVPQILREVYRVLKPGSIAFVGGGFGASTPNDLIETHLPRSHELNRALNKARLSTNQLERYVAEAQLSDVAGYDHRHGLWAILRRPA